MNLLEIIEIRTPHKFWTEAEKVFQMLLADIKNHSCKMEIKLYKRLNMDTDYSIQLIIDSHDCSKDCSVLGSKIIDQIKHFGIVNHTVWKEIQ